MPLDLYGRESLDRLSTLSPIEAPEANAFDGFVRGSAMYTMRGFAGTARAIDMLGAVGPIAQDAFTGGTEAQDRYFKEHDEVFGSAVDYWTPRPGEVGMAGEVVGGLASLLPKVILSPALAVGSEQLGAGEELVKKGVPAGKAQTVGAITGAATGLGLWMPILGRNLWERILVGGAGYNVTQGVVTRGANQLILAGTEAEHDYRAFDPGSMTLDALLGAAFGTLAHVSPEARKQGATAWNRIRDWAETLKPTEVDAIAALRQAEHMNVDSMPPGKPVGPEDVIAHVDRLKTAIEQLARNEPVEVSDHPAPRLEAASAEEMAHYHERFAELQAETLRMRDFEFLPPPDFSERMAELASTETPYELAGPVSLEVTDRMRMRERLQELMGERDTAAPERQTAIDEEIRGMREQLRTPEPEPQLPIGERIRGQLEQMGHIGPEEREAYAKTTQAFFEATAKRVGVTPEQLAERFPIEATGAAAPAHALEQAMPIFYSELGRQIEALPADRVPAAGLTAKEWKKVLIEPGTTRRVAIRDERNRPTGETKEVTVPEHPALPGVKAEEIKWSGIEDWLEAQGGKVTKDQVRAFLEHGGVTVGEQQFGGPLERTPQDAIVAPRTKRLEEQGFHLDQDPEGGRWGLVTPDGDIWVDAADARMAFGEDKFHLVRGVNREWLIKADSSNAVIGRLASNLSEDAAAQIARSQYRNTLEIPPEYRELVQDATLVLEHLNDKSAPQTKFGSYQLPGGTSYRELVLTLPLEEPAIGRLLPDEEQWAKTTENLNMRASGGGTGEHTVWEAVIAGKNYRIIEMTGDRIPENRRFVLDGGGLANAGSPTLAEAMVRAQYHTQYPEIMHVGGGELAMRGELTRNKPFAFQSSHFPDVENPLAHIRFNDRVDAEGKKVLFVEEIQSDWAQKGKREGFKPGGPMPSELPQGVRAIPERTAQEKAEEGGIGAAAMIAQSAEAAENQRNFLISQGVKPEDVLFVDQAERRDPGDRYLLYTTTYHVMEPGGEIMAHAGSTIDTYSEAGALKGALQYMQNRWRDQQGRKIAEAPFVGKTESWVALALKRMIRYAAEHGYERLAWTTGEQQVGRYEQALREKVDAIEWKKTPEGVQLVGYKRTTSDRFEDLSPAVRGAVNEVMRANDYLGFDTLNEALGAVREHPNDWQSRWQLIDPADTVPIERYLEAVRVAKQTRQKVVDTTQKETELSDAIGKAMADKIRNDPAQAGTIEGADLRIDDTGMAGFYDRIVPNVANDVLKKLGGGKVGKTEITRPSGDYDMPTLQPATEADLQGFAGAEEFRNGQPPLIGEGRIRIQGTDTDTPINVSVIADRNGLHFVDQEGANFAATWQQMAVPRATDQASARYRLERLWEDPNSVFWRVLRDEDPEGYNFGPVTTAAKGTDQHSIDITPALKERALKGMPLFQGGPGAPRGYYAKGQPSLLGLLEHADRSTFLHESGHFYLDVLDQLATEGHPDLAADRDILLDWFGVKDRQSWDGMDPEQRRPYHEQFARGFETYLGEGVAPTDALKGVFERFKEWLVAIYESLTRLNAPISDEVRGVMARMLGGEHPAEARPPGEATEPARIAQEPAAAPETQAPAEAPIAQAAPETAPAAAPPAAEPEIPAAPAARKARATGEVVPVTPEQLFALRELGREAGWLEMGGRLDMGRLKDPEKLGTPAFTKWIPKADWWLDFVRTPTAKMNEAELRNAIEKAAEGEPLRKQEQRAIEYLLPLAEERLAGYGPEATKRLMEREGKEGEPQSPLAAQADRFVAQNPDLELTVGQNADGTPIRQRASEILDQAREARAQADADAELIRQAIECIPW